MIYFVLITKYLWHCVKVQILQIILGTYKLKCCTLVDTHTLGPNYTAFVMKLTHSFCKLDRFVTVNYFSHLH
jgi:hypothetical protein